MMTQAVMQSVHQVFEKLFVIVVTFCFLKNYVVAIMLSMGMLN